MIHNDNRRERHIDKCAQRLHADPTDQQAWSQLYSLTRQRLMAIVAARVGSDDAQDALQEAWVNAYRAFRRYDPNRPFMPWMYKITQNTAYDRLRAKTRRPICSGLDGAPEQPARARTEEEIVATEELRSLLREMTPDLREIVIDHYYGDIPWAVIAQAKGRPEATVRNQAKRALERWRLAQSDESLSPKTDDNSHGASQERLNPPPLPEIPRLNEERST